MSEFNKKKSDRELFEELFDPEEDKRMWQNTFKNEGIEEGIEKGIEQGIEQGKRETQINMAKEMLKLDNITIEQISQVTKLSIEEIEKLN